MSTEPTTQTTKPQVTTAYVKPKGIFSAIRDVITTTIGTATDVVTAAQESVQMGTTYVHNRAIAQQLTDRETVVLDTTLQLEGIQAELEGNSKRQALFDRTSAAFD